MPKRIDAKVKERCVRLVQDSGCRLCAEPAGLFGWVDVGMDAEALAQRLLDAGWLLAPGSLFHAGRRPSTLMRINFACSQDPRFWRLFEGMRHPG